MYEDQQDQEYMEQPTRKSSPAKSAIAQQKPRDDKGHFLSGQELQNYQHQKQSIQLAAERYRMNQLLGNRGTIQSSQGNNPLPTGDKFRDMLRSNGAGGGRTINQSQTNSTTESSSSDKWDILLGKKKSNIRW